MNSPLQNFASYLDEFLDEEEVGDDHVLEDNRYF